MNYKKMRILITVFISSTVAMAVSLNNIYLAIGGVLIGMLSLILLRKKSKEIVVDERIQDLAGKAARLSYAVLTSVLAFISLILLFSSRSTGGLYTEALGTTFSYIALLNVALYSMSYKYYSKKYGDINDDE